MSCDLLPTEIPGQHAQYDIMEVIKVYESGDKLEIRSEVNILKAKKKSLKSVF